MKTQQTYRMLLRSIFIFSLFLSSVAVSTHLFFDNQSFGLWNSTEKLIEGSAEKPFIYRVLTPYILKHILAAIPEKYKARLILNKHGEQRTLEGIKHYQWKTNIPEIFAISYLWAFVLLSLCFYIWRKLLASYTSIGPSGLDIAPALAMLALPHLFIKGAYIYDMTELFLFSLGLLSFLKKRWIAYYIIFTLAILNKETGIFLGAWLMYYLLQKQYKFVAMHSILHLLISLPILIGIRLYYAHHEGGMVLNHLAYNLDFFLSYEPWISFGDMYAFHIPTPRAFNIINLLLFFGPLALYWKQLDKLFKTIFCSMVLCLFPLYIAFGFKDEIRVFYPVIPIFILLYTQAIHLFYKDMHNSKNIGVSTV